MYVSIAVCSLRQIITSIVVMEGLASLQPQFVCSDSSHMQRRQQKCSRDNTVLFILVSNKILLFFMFIHVLLIRMYTTRFRTLSLIKKKLKLSFLVLEDNYAIIQLSWA